MRSLYLISIVMLLLNAGCGRSPSEEATRIILDTLGGSAPEGFAQVTEPRPFRFPDDDGPHPTHHLEWWYFTGNLESGERHFGFELTFFRVGLVPVRDDLAKDMREQSAWRTEQLYLAHFALTDTESGEFYYAERLTRGALGLAGVESGPLRVWNETWQVEAQGDDLSIPFPMQLSASDSEFGVQLTLDALKPRVYPGKAGFSVKGPEPGNASYYLTFPRLSARGEIWVGPDRWTVEGLAWMDHEWSTSVLGHQLSGWDWFSLQFDDGTELMLYELRRRDGTRGQYSQGLWIDDRGRTQTLSQESFEIEILDRWRSPHTGARYPSRWALRVPELDLELTATPVIADQELNLRTVYWEGAIRVEGTRASRRIQGRGYVELVGYTDTENGS